MFSTAYSIVYRLHLEIPRKEAQAKTQL